MLFTLARGDYPPAWVHQGGQHQGDEAGVHRVHEGRPMVEKLLLLLESWRAPLKIAWVKRWEIPGIEAIWSPCPRRTEATAPNPAPS